MPYEAKKQKCKKEDGSSGTHAIYKKGTNEKVGCTSDPSGYMGKLYSVEETTEAKKIMKISRKELKKIIKEHLDEATLDNLTQEAALGESPAEIRNITDLKNLFNARSQGATDSYGSVRATGAVEFTTTEVDDAVRELERAIGWLRMFRLADDTPVKELKET